jgi:hypothetical protein
MKITELQKLIREEVRKVMNEAKTWDKKAILKFFKYLADNHGMKAKNAEFKTDTSGNVEILMGGPVFDAKFMVDGNNLIFKETSDSDATAEDFVEDIEYDGAEGYKLKVKGKFAIVN